MIDWILSSSINAWVLNTFWAWPLFETLHFFGLSLMLGALLVIDLRMLGYLNGLSFSATHRLLPLVFAGFVINLFTGFMFVMGDPERYFIHTGFQLKILLVVLGGLNALWFALRISKPMHQWSTNSDITLEAKAVGCLSLIFWFGVLLLGRLIPYVSTG